jgi:hypothetical protein
MDGDLNKEISRLKPLKGNKGASQEELERKAMINLRVREFRANPLFLDTIEMKLSEDRFKAYLDANELESMSEIDTLRSLVYNEVFESRIQKQLNEMARDNKAPSDKITKQLTDIQNQKLSLKTKLGIDKADEEVDELTGLEILKKRYKDYINNHRNEFTVVCPHGQLMLLRRRVKDFDSMAHPWFAGRWFFNYEILKDVKAGKLSKDDAWRYSCCASQGEKYKPAFDKKYCVDFINYCLDHWAEITDFFEKK